MLTFIHVYAEIIIKHRQIIETHATLDEFGWFFLHESYFKMSKKTAGTHRRKVCLTQREQTIYSLFVFPSRRKRDKI